MPRLKSNADLAKLKKQILSKKAGKRYVSINAAGTCGLAYGSDKVYKALMDEIKKQGLSKEVEVRATGCLGFCENSPKVMILPDDINYFKVKPEDVAEIVSKTLVENKVVDRLLYKDGGKKVVKIDDIPFYRGQSRIVTGNNRYIDPESINDYIALGGYSALAQVLGKMNPKEVLDVVKQSNLRGRGGGGFPTGVKWETSVNAQSDIKYVIVNADEGDPGAYMNRALLEGNPHSVIEGLIIGAYAVGAKEGYVYVRQEYPLAIKHLYVALEQARDYGLLGDNILGSGFDFDIVVHQGAGAFVSGESSALMTAIEGRVGEPRPKYIRTAVSGVREKPSILNNVETWANVPLIINNGVDWFTGIGAKENYGTKIFSLVGKVNNTGLVEVPLGTTLRQIIFDCGGGIRKGKKFKAVQTGGPSGGCIPASMLDMPVDFDQLTKAGSMMGSGGMIVMDEDSCMVDVARYFLDFLAFESCGKCVPCREGIRQMLKVLNRICDGKGKEGDIQLLESLADVLKDASLCALGQTAANPVMSTIKYFRDEYEAHIKEKRCPAGVCKALVSYYIVPEKCQACGICLRECPVGAITGEKGIVHVIDQGKCTKCGSCIEVCPAKFDAVAKISGKPVPKAPEKMEVIRKKEAKS
ncbi:MAG: NADH-quinone oxidoreductase subunit NuoF [Dehalococcoidia bacterium]|jgi:NADH-quinone oxidoreductase subunit F